MYSSLTDPFCHYFRNLFIFLSFIGDGQTFVVTWTTLSPTTSSVIGSIVEFGSDPENLENSIHGTEEVFVDGGDEKRKEYIHRVIFPKSANPSSSLVYVHCGASTHS